MSKPIDQEEQPLPGESVAPLNELGKEEMQNALLDSGICLTAEEFSDAWAEFVEEKERRARTIQ